MIYSKKCKWDCKKYPSDSGHVLHIYSSLNHKFTNFAIIIFRSVCKIPPEQKTAGAVIGLNISHKWNEEILLKH